MTNECPQCKFPVPREGSRFCNQCGFDLRAFGSSDPTAIEMAETMDDTVPPVSMPALKASERVSPQTSPNISVKTHMTGSQETKLQAPSQPEATLHILLRDGNVIERDLKGAETKIGKGPQNDIILPDASVSATHVMISFADGVFTLNDLGSRNGTFVNDARVTDSRKLEHGDLIKMGHCTITFRLKEAESTLSIPRTLLLDQAPPPPVPPPTPKVVAPTEESLAQALVSSGLVAQGEVDRLRGTGAPNPARRRLCRALIEENLVTEIGLRDLMSRTFNIPLVELKTMEIDAPLATRLGAEFLRARIVCPVVSQQPDRLMLAVADPTDKTSIEEVERRTGKKASLRLAKLSEITSQIDSHFTPRLIGVLPTGEKIEALLNQSETEIGKAAHNKLVISDPTVSSTHAVVLVRDGGYSVVDLGSSNGTFINGNKLTAEAYTLQHGDKIQLGNVLLTFRNPAETTENKTARLSLEALEEVRRRAALRSDPAAPIPRTDPSAWSAPSAGVPPSKVVTAAEDDEERAEKKKKKKDKDKGGFFSANALSRIIAQVMGAVVTIVGTIVVAKYVLQPSMPGGGGTTTTSSSAKIARSNSWTSLPGGKIEASGVASVPGSDWVLMVDDGQPGAVLAMQLDSVGEPIGVPKTVPLGVTIKNPEAITSDGSRFYVIGSQSDAAWGGENAIARFSFDPQTQTLRGQAEIIYDFRGVLLNKIPELKGLGETPSAQGGLNIEGLAWDKLNDRLLVGLRSLLAGQAVIVPFRLNNPGGPFTAENLTPENPRVILLPLGNQGIREITYDTHLKSFLIISGAPEGVEKADFKLWEWNGESVSSKVREEMMLEPKFKPEGLTYATIGGRPFLFLVGDASSYLKLEYSDTK
jgi:pSer/pThr/pTyr-binding forkhead associated (FHA) protein